MAFLYSLPGDRKASIRCNTDMARIQVLHWLVLRRDLFSDIFVELLLQSPFLLLFFAFRLHFPDLILGVRPTLCMFDTARNFCIFRCILYLGIVYICCTEHIHPNILLLLLVLARLLAF